MGGAATLEVKKMEVVGKKKAPSYAFLPLEESTLFSSSIDDGKRMGGEG